MLWNDRENADHVVLTNLIEQTKMWLLNHKYEIDNHFTIFDWCKIYSEALLDQELDMNLILKAVEGENTGFKSYERTDKEWTQLAQVAKFFADFKDANKYLKRDCNAGEMTEFLTKHTERSDSSDHASIWQKALHMKNEFLKEQKQKNTIDRSEIIRTQLADFNRLQDLSRKRDDLVRRLERTAALQSTRVQDIVSETLNSPKTYIDFEKLADLLD